MALMRVQHRLGETQAGKQAPVAGQDQPHAEMKPRQATSLALRRFTWAGPIPM